MLIMIYFPRHFWSIDKINNVFIISKQYEERYKIEDNITKLNNMIIGPCGIFDTQIKCRFK